MITKELYEELKKITEEEASILGGRMEIEKDIYMRQDARAGEADMIDAKKLLDEGKLIQVRPHTRFVYFPKHTHNYIEMVYMCSGSTHHVIDGVDVMLHEGEILFLNQNAKQEIYPAAEDDIAVNFIILPEFFNYVLKMLGEEKNLLRDFIVDCLTGKSEESGYLHFKVADVFPVHSLVENLIWSIWNRQPNRRSINQITMGLLFLHLMNHMEFMETNAGKHGRLLIEIYGYIEERYRDGTLTELAGLLNYDVYWLSKEIRKRTGCSYTQLVQEKRLSQAAYLLQNTAMSVADTGLAVGYDNLSYFHRIFYKCHGMTPRQYRLKDNGK